MGYRRRIRRQRRRRRRQRAGLGVLRLAARACRTAIVPSALQVCRSDSRSSTVTVRQARQYIHTHAHTHTHTHIHTHTTTHNHTKASTTCTCACAVVRCPALALGCVQRWRARLRMSSCAVLQDSRPLTLVSRARSRSLSDLHRYPPLNQRSSLPFSLPLEQARKRIACTTRCRGPQATR